MDLIELLNDHLLPQDSTLTPAKLQICRYTKVLDWNCVTTIENYDKPAVSKDQFFLHQAPEPSQSPTDDEELDEGYMDSDLSGDRCSFHGWVLVGLSPTSPGPSPD